MNRSIATKAWTLAFLAALLPVMFLRDFTPSNELRYLSIADEALRNHTFFTFYNHGVPYADKPPLYLWLVMLCKWLTGTHRMWLLSLFSVLPAIGIVYRLDSWTRKESRERGLETAPILLLSCGFFIGTSLVLRMDMLMTFFIVMALHAFWKMFNQKEPGKSYGWLFPMYLFLAVFTKGPYGILIPLVSTTVFLLLSGSIRQFFRYWGIRTWLTLAVLCGIWFGMVCLEGGNAYLNNLLFHQTIDRAVDSFHHNKPFYYYAISIWYVLAPWSLLVVGIIVAALRPRAERRTLQVYFLTIVITSFVLISCVSSKIDIYMLPTIPFMVYAAALSLSKYENHRLTRMAVSIPISVLTLTLPLLVAAVRMDYMPMPVPPMLYVAAAILSVGSMITLIMLWKSYRHRSFHRSASCMAGTLFLAVFTGGWAAGDLNAHIGYGALCEKALELSAGHGIDDIRVWDISRPENMDVYLHRPFRVIEGDSLPAFGKDGPCLLLLPKDKAPLLPHRPQADVGSNSIIIIQASENKKK